MRRHAAYLNAFLPSAISAIEPWSIESYERSADRAHRGYRRRSVRVARRRSVWLILRSASESIGHSWVQAAQHQRITATLPRMVLSGDISPAAAQRGHWAGARLRSSRGGIRAPMRNTCQLQERLAHCVKSSALRRVGEGDSCSGRSGMAHCSATMSRASFGGKSSTSPGS
jgi:hypothetical protein